MTWITSTNNLRKTRAFAQPFQQEPITCQQCCGWIMVNNNPQVFVAISIIGKIVIPKYNWLLFFIFSCEKGLVKFFFRPKMDFVVHFTRNSYHLTPGSDSRKKISYDQVKIRLIPDEYYNKRPEAWANFKFKFGSSKYWNRSCFLDGCDYSYKQSSSNYHFSINNFNM